MTEYKMTLSTTEPNNYVGLIKLRQGDVASQSIQATITANGQLFKFDGLSVFFNAVLPNGNVIRDIVTGVDYVNSKLNYVVADSFLQEVAQVTAWFSFENGNKTIDSTKNFQYSVIGGWKECIPQGNYIYELSEIQREIEEIISNKDFTSLISKISSIEQKYNEFSQKAIDLPDLKTKMNTIYNNAVSDHTEVTEARGYTNKLVDRLDQMEQTVQDVSVIGGQIDTLIANAGNGTVPSELTDMRVAFDGQQYGTAGKAVREQFGGVNYLLDQVIYRSKNIFDTSNVLSGCFISNNTGTALVNESFSSYYFPVDFTQTLSFNSVFVDSRIIWVSSSQDMSKYSVGDVIDGFVSAIANTAAQNVSTPSGAIGVVVSIPTVKATLAQVEYGQVSTAYEPYKIGIDSDKVFGKEVSSLTVGTDKMYTTIQSAVDASKDGDTITIYPGTYWEAVDAKTKLVNIVGISKKLCILEYPNGAYSKPPLEIAKGSVTNLTIRATAQAKIPGEVAKAYAVHIDSDHQLGHDLKFENVHFIDEDYQTLGIGLRNNSSLEFINCVIESGNHNAFYCHSQPTSTAADGQNLLLKNCTIINNSSSFCAIKMQSQPYELAVAIATFQGNVVVNRGGTKILEMVRNGDHSTVSHNGWLGSTEWQLGIVSATNNVDVLNF